MLEAAAVMPVFVAILLGLLEFGWAITVTHQMNAGTRSGARLAVLAGSTEADVEERVRQVAARDTLPVTITIIGGAGSGLADAEPGDIIEVSSELPYSEIGLVVPEYLTNGFNLKAKTTMRHE